MYRERIAQVYNQLSPSYRRIADFLLNNYREAAFMTAAELGQAVNVDTTTVVRCAQRLGYDGYPELIDDVQAQVKAELQSSYQPAANDTSVVATWHRCLIQDIENLRQLLQLPSEMLETTVDAIRSARRIFVLGHSYAGALCQAFAAKLSHLGFWADAVSSEIGLQAHALSQVQPGDLVIGVATGSYGGEVAAGLEQAKELGAKTVGLFTSYANPAARAAEIKIHTPGTSPGAYVSLTALAAALEAIVQILASGEGVAIDEVAARYQRHYQNLMTYRDWEPPDFQGGAEGKPIELS
ncbi:MAG: MurR/RpiR family transcriptional regulator [Anaerolineae bacterium]